MTNPGKLLTHQWLLRRVWGPGYASESHYLRVYVRAIRRKLGDARERPPADPDRAGRGVPVDRRRVPAGSRAVAGPPAPPAP